MTNQEASTAAPPHVSQDTITYGSWRTEKPFLDLEKDLDNLNKVNKMTRWAKMPKVWFKLLIPSSRVILKGVERSEKVLLNGT